eukprot:5065498-Lingulodinium_polyedra.AAC.1
MVRASCLRACRIAARRSSAARERPRRCAACLEGYATMRPNQPSATAATRKSHARAVHARARELARAR